MDTLIRFILSIFTIELKFHKKYFFYISPIDLAFQSNNQKIVQLLIGHKSIDLTDIKNIEEIIFINLI